MTYTDLFLLDIVNSAPAPDYIDDGRFHWSLVSFPARDGWKVVFSYRSAELSRVDHLVTPQGMVIPVDGVQRLECWYEDDWQRYLASEKVQGGPTEPTTSTWQIAAVPIHQTPRSLDF
ncbi:hypothetical protein O9X99_02010 [Agrobacterium salinitolerans]|uniref:Uncharacterized protein n=1 Tax=Agrobacterium salinitolerans TaxID=1183413 RepID=A0ABY3BWS3_9HYPH|nr:MULTISPECIES: hypothetical protein [Agrobacterium]MCZ7890442.1 hypothetical protein [Agrobacterium salinitolerans]TRA96836.1 hypothetical protein EXN23_00945 [Agrobacterium salinitolerans]